jgi:hypothetical protein
MSSTPVIVTTIASFAVTAGAGVTAFVKQARKYESDLYGYIKEFNKYLDELEAAVSTVDAKVTTLIPAPAPAPAAPTAANRAKKASKAVKSPAKRLR